MAHAYNLGFLEAEAGTKSSGLPGLYNEILSSKFKSYSVVAFFFFFFFLLTTHKALVCKPSIVKINNKTPKTQGK